MPRSSCTALDTLIEYFEEVGLAIHEVEKGSTQQIFLGLELCKKTFSVKKTRPLQLRYCFDEALQRRTLPSRVLAVLAGHCNWCIMVSRSLLSFFDGVYRHIREVGDMALPMLRDVRREICITRDILPLLRANVSAPWLTTVSASDASLMDSGTASVRFLPQLSVASAAPARKGGIGASRPLPTGRAPSGTPAPTSASASRTGTHPISGSTRRLLRRSPPT